MILNLKIKLKNMNKNLILNLSNNDIVELIFKYEFDDYLTYDLYVRNWFFSWKSSMCFSKENLKFFWNSIIKLWLKDQIIINDNDSDAYIKIIKSDNLWHYSVIIQVWWTHEDYFCKITFQMDQFIIEKLYNFLSIL